MKKILCLAAGLLALNLTPAFSQPNPPMQGMPPGTTFQQRMQAIQGTVSAQTEAPELTKFNLDFPGGTPKQLVAAIEKALGKPLNVIVPTDEKTAKVMLPPIKVNDMDVARLFKSLESRKYEHNEEIYGHGFYTEDQPPKDTPKDNSLWTFKVYEKQSALTKFNLDFPGGTPAQLVKAIEKAMGKPLNVIINKEDENLDLPALKMNDVYLPQLFSALEAASRKTVAVSSQNYPGGYSQFSAGFGFKTADTVTDTSVWYFHVEKPLLPPVIPSQKVCQYYQLAQYLDRGFTVDDITTAIQTGWKMAGVTPTPELNYHKETKLLMAYGEPDKLKTIDDVLKTLPPSNITAAAGVTYWKHIQDLQGQIDELKKKIGAPDSATNTAPAEKSGK